MKMPKGWFKKVVIVVMQVWGLIFMLASLAIVGGELFQMVRALQSTGKHDFHWDPWLGSIGVGSFGALLWQTGKITTTLEVWAPLIRDFIKSRIPGGRRSSDPPLSDPIIDPMELPPPPRRDYTGEEGP